MPNSSNSVVKQKFHRERGQPEARKKYGVLEKRKDYQIRAKNFKEKQETIKKLKEKARLRNPDEFYFKMIDKEVK